MCLTAAIGEYPDKIGQAGRNPPAFDALYGVCSYADR
jgi:hypothetical protein